MKTVFDIEKSSHFDEDMTSYIIILADTGLFWTAQAGGVGCLQLEAEGWVITIPEIDFDDCQYGCAFFDEKRRKNLADDLQLMFDKDFEDMIKFDYDRIGELEEGWWPVLYYLKPSYWMNGEWVKAIIHNGNCD